MNNEQKERSQFATSYYEKLVSQKQNLSIHEKLIVGTYANIIKALLRAANNNHEDAESIANLVYTTKDPKQLKAKEQKHYLLSSAFNLSERALEHLSYGKKNIALLLDQQANGLLGSYTGYKINNQQNGNTVKTENKNKTYKTMADKYFEVLPDSINPSTAKEKVREYMEENGLYGEDKKTKTKKKPSRKTVENAIAAHPQTIHSKKNCSFSI